MYVERPLELCVEGHAIRTIDMRRWGITKARFEDLATKRYYTNHVRFETYVADGSPGNLANRWRGAISDEALWPENATLGQPYEPFNEYEDAAVNYTDEDNAYWPIPNSEEQTNPFIYGK